MPFSKQAKTHLAQYKLDTLRIEEQGIWSRNGLHYPHILPRERLAMNLLPQYRDDLVQYIADHGITLHTDAHHLNSSQILALNLLYPATIAQTTTQLDFVETLIGARQPVTHWHFEAVPVPSEGSNIDLVLTHGDGSRTLIELKYTEVNFGVATSNRKRLAKLDDFYRPRLESRVPAWMLEPDEFFSRYQLMRNLSLCEPNKDHLVLVMPKENDNALGHAEDFVRDVNQDFENRVRIVFVEQLVDCLDQDEQLFGTHYQDFRAKYLF